MHDVLIPVYNGSDYIGETIECISKQTIKNIRIVVSDNASTDDTIKKIPKLQNVEIIKNAVNIGMFGNFNLLAGKIDGNTITFLSHDDKFAVPDALEQALQILEDNPTVAVVFSDLEYIDAEGRVIGQRKFRPDGLFDPLEVAKKSIITTRNLFGIPLAIRAQVLQGDLLFDETLKYASDLDFAIRIGQQLGGPYHIAKSLVQYRIHGGNETLQVQSRSKSDMNKIATKNNIKLSIIESIIQSGMFLFVNQMRKAMLNMMIFKERILRHK